MPPSRKKSLLVFQRINYVLHHKLYRIPCCGKLVPHLVKKHSVVVPSNRQVNKFFLNLLSFQTSILTVPHKKREKENIFQNILNDFCPTIDSKLKHGKSPSTQLQSKSCPSSWSTRLFTLDEMFATDSWHISRGKLLWQVKSEPSKPHVLFINFRSNDHLIFQVGTGTH